MSNRLISAQIGFFTGSFVYFLFLWVAVLCEHYGIFQRNSNSPNQSFDIICTFAPAEPFWYRAVSNAALSHRAQPHFLYLTALIFAAVFAWAQRPVRAESIPKLPAIVLYGCMFWAAVLVNLWFSGANILPRYVRL